jgi:hypothetical protein
MKPTQAWFRHVKTAAHGAALVFSLFWLVATSAEAVPAQDCFTGLANPTKIAVVLGTPVVDPSSTQPDTSCAGIDGLVPGATLIFSVSQGPRPTGSFGHCYGYDTEAIDGVSDVQLRLTSGSGYDGFTYATGNYASPAGAGCKGVWGLTLGPNMIPENGHPISPVDTAARWHLERDISVDDAQSCGGTFTGSGPLTCRDRFPIVSITEMAP